MTRRERRDAVAKLRDLATRFDAAASRAYTLDAEDSRRREAAQIRMVAVLVQTSSVTKRPSDALSFAALWLAAGEQMLAYHDRVDMDAVHASRSSRRSEVKP